MFQILTILIVVIAVILSFVIHPEWAWLPIALIDLFICIQLLVLKQTYRFNYIYDLSSEANKLLKRYGNYFAMPFASKDFSASAATSQFAGIAIAIIGLLKGFWWAIALAVGNWILMGYVSVSLSPVSILAKSPFLAIVHDEIFEWIINQRN
jgi:phosphoglycerol transferase MdoB-like AlkP superfamily enzyme